MKKDLLSPLNLQNLRTVLHLREYLCECPTWILSKSSCYLQVVVVEFVQLLGEEEIGREERENNFTI